MSGVGSVATVTMGLIALPAMFKRGYDKSMVLGSIMAGGALGILIPPKYHHDHLCRYCRGVSGQAFHVRDNARSPAQPVVYWVYWCSMLFKTRYGTSGFPEKFSIINKSFSRLRGIILPILLVMFVLGKYLSGDCHSHGSCGHRCLWSPFCA